MKSLTTLPSCVALAILVAACAKNEPAAPADGSRVALRPSDPVTVNADPLVVKLIRVDGDSRCPIDVTCVTAGNAVVVFTASIGSVEVVPAEQSVNTTVEPRSVTVGGYTFRLDSLLPHPVSTRTIAQSEYVAHMTVTSAPAN